jgi:hypothetical protein
MVDETAEEPYEMAMAGHDRGHHRHCIKWEMEQEVSLPSDHNPSSVRRSSLSQW